MRKCKPRHPGSNLFANSSWSPSANELSSASAVLRATCVCLRAFHVMGIKVPWGPLTTRNKRLVDFAVCGHPPRSASQNKSMVQSCGKSNIGRWRHKFLVELRYEINRSNCLSQLRLHFVTWPANEQMEYARSGRHNLVTHNNFINTLEALSATCPVIW